MPEKKQYNKKTTTPENVSDEKVVEEFVVFKPYKVYPFTTKELK